jgi:hypothetical protein
MNHRIKLLHSCSCIAFDCWNSNSEFEFKCLSSFQIVHFFYPPPSLSPFQPITQTRPRPASPHRGPTPRLAQPAQQAAAASPFRLLPRPQSMTGGDHLSSPSPRRIPLGLPGRVRPAAARTPSVLGPHAKAVTRSL